MGILICLHNRLSCILQQILLLLTKMRIDIAECRNAINRLNGELRSTLAEIATMNRQVMALQSDQLRLPQLEMELRFKQQRKDEIKDKISCLELEIKNEELQQRIDENNRRLESARQAQNELRSRFA